jgi:hypothetical protein
MALPHDHFPKIGIQHVSQHVYLQHFDDMFQFPVKLRHVACDNSSINESILRGHSTMYMKFFRQLGTDMFL